MWIWIRVCAGREGRHRERRDAADWSPGCPSSARWPPRRSGALAEPRPAHGAARESADDHRAGIASPLERCQAQPRGRLDRGPRIAPRIAAGMRRHHQCLIRNSRAHLRCCGVVRCCSCLAIDHARPARPAGCWRITPQAVTWTRTGPWRCHAPIKSRRRSSGGYGRQNKSRSDPAVDRAKQSQPAAAREPNPTHRTPPAPQHHHLTGVSSVVRPRRTERAGASEISECRAALPPGAGRAPR
jgi:hypothetical protein